MPDIAPSVSSSRATSLRGLFALDGLRQQSLQQGKRLQRLTEIMARRGEKARLRGIRELRLALRDFECVRRRVCVR